MQVTYIAGETITAATGLFCSYSKSDSNVQNFVNIFCFQQKEVRNLLFISNKITSKLILYIRFSSETNNELSARFKGSKTGNKLKMLVEF